MKSTKRTKEMLCGVIIPKVFWAKNKYNNLHTAKIIELKKITVGMYLKKERKERNKKTPRMN